MPVGSGGLGALAQWRHKSALSGAGPPHLEHLPIRMSSFLGATFPSVSRPAGL